MKIIQLKLLDLIKIMIVLLSLSGCVKDLEDQEIYQRPDWLAGKLYEQITKQDNLNTFITCLKKTGYDSLLNTSGSFTVIAPTDEAFEKFFQNHPEYNSVEDIPDEKLKALVEYQIIYNAWTRKQFKSLDVFGWIDPDNQSYNEPRGYKRQTIYKEENKSYPAVRDRMNGYFQIVNSEESPVNKIAYVSSNKYVPIFFKEYLNIYGLGGYDYEFYFDRNFDSDNLYYADAVIDSEIPAENGFIYKSDNVVLPLPTAETLLEEGYQDDSYNTFLDMIHEFSQLTINYEATYDQPGADLGLDVDTLYNLEYPYLLFNIASENTRGSALTIREHYGLLAPTDEAFNSFKEEYIRDGWGSLEDTPDEIKSIIINTHMTSQAIYPKDFAEGFLNGVNDRIYVNESNVVQKEYSSNSSFMGISEVIVPRAFKSVSRPVYLERGYEIMLKAMEATKVISAVKDQNSEFVFYVPADINIGLYGGDSSLYIHPERLDFRAQNMNQGKEEKLPLNLLRKIILNQIGIKAPTGIAQKEFIENLGGNYIIVDHNKGTVSGTAQSTFGYKGNESIDIVPELYEKETDNGQTYRVNGFFSFTNRTFWSLFTSRFTRFQSLLLKAGLYDDTHNSYPFLTKTEYYTVFIPSDSVIDAHQLDTLPKDELREILKYHFVKGKLIFTDGSQAEDFYKTTRVDESSTEIETNYSKLHIRPTPDVIKILDKNGDVYLSIPENENTTNIVTTIDPDESSDMEYENIVTGVVHEIDKLLVKELLFENN